jgi:hypothetical protein
MGWKQKARGSLGLSRGLSGKPGNEELTVIGPRSPDAREAAYKGDNRSERPCNDLRRKLGELQLSHSRSLDGAWFFDQLPSRVFRCKAVLFVERAMLHCAFCMPLAFFLKKASSSEGAG